MKTNIPNISRKIYNDEILKILQDKYSIVGPMWVTSQLEWINSIYAAFKDHDKYLIIIYLIKKTLDFYSRNFIKLSYDEFYSKNTVEIEKFNIIEISNSLNIPKESTRRKVIELENDGIIKRFKKKIIVDRSSFSFIKPTNSLKRISRFLSVLTEMLVREKILLKPLSSDEVEKVIKDNFSYVWKVYYELQIPMILSYKKVFGDIESFAVFGTCVVNQHLSIKKLNKKIEREKFIQAIYSDVNMQGVNAMSISDITGIPRATVVRKLKKLLKLKILNINNKKHYSLTGSFVKKLVPIQSRVLKRLADFSSKIYNLAIL